MIAVDSSALLAIVLNESSAARCTHALEAEDRLVISAVVLSEVLIVAGSRGYRNLVEAIIERLDIEIVPVTRAFANDVVLAYDKWGKGRHPAALNIVDCYSYVLAKSTNCPLLFIGNDFSQTDIRSAI